MKFVKKLTALLTAVMFVVQTVMPTYANETTLQTTANINVQVAGSGIVQVNDGINQYSVSSSSALNTMVVTGTNLHFSVQENAGLQIDEFTMNGSVVSGFLSGSKSIESDVLIDQDTNFFLSFSELKIIDDNQMNNNVEIKSDANTDDLKNEDELDPEEDDLSGNIPEQSQENQKADEGINQDSEKEGQPFNDSDKLKDDENINQSINESDIENENKYDISIFPEGFNGFGSITFRSSGWKIMSLEEFNWYNGAGNIHNGRWSLSNGKYAFCGEGMMAPPPVGATTSEPTVYDNANVRKALYYGYGGPGDILTGTYGEAGAVILTNEALSNAYSGTCLSKEVAQGYHWNLNVGSIVNNIYSQPDPIQYGYVAYKVETAGQGLNWQNIITDLQDLFYIGEMPTGELAIKKLSANPSITDNNSCYSLEGTEYGVYRNSNATDQAGTITIKSDGSSNKLTLDAGTYYLQETKAGKGYALDTNIYSVNVVSGQLTTKNLTDYPQSDPISILLGKVDSETNANKPQGSASLANAEFTVKYYKGLYDSDPATQGQSPVRTWVLRTNDNGLALLSDSYKISGDDFYYTSTGEPTLPVGTLTIQETQAPEGYYINNEVFVRKITTNGVNEFVDTYNNPTIPEQVIKGKIRVAKKDNDSGKVIQIAGTVFDIYFNDQKVDTITTDSTGYATSKDLPFGQYVVKESKAPHGYVVDVNQQATVTISEGHTYDTILVDQRTTGKVNITKLDKETGTRPQGEATLQGAEYGIYAKENIVDPSNDGTVLYHKDELVGTITTDENGRGSLDKMYMGQYYLQETKPSSGYELDETQYPFTLTYKDDQTATIEVASDVLETIRTGQFEIIKFMTSGETSEIVLNEEGAEFVAVLQSDYEANDNDIQKALAYAKANRTNKEYAVLVTDKEGHAVSPDLAYGKYVIKQTKKGINASESDMLKNPFYFEVAETEQGGDTIVRGEDDKNNEIAMGSDGLIHYHINNRPSAYYVQIVKKDADTGKTVNLNNATFQIVKYKDNGEIDANYSRGNVRTDENGIVSVKSGLLWYDTFVTNADNRLSIIEHVSNWEAQTSEELGTVTVPIKLPSGDYAVKEIVAPEGYLLGSDIPFSLNQDDVTMTDEYGDAYLVVEFSNPKPTGRIELIKEFEDPDYIMHGEVTFDLYVTQDIIDPADGTVLYKAGDKYGTYTLNKDNNTIVIEGLPMGVGESHFKLVEKTTYENYQLNEQEFALDFIKTNNLTSVYSQQVIVQNELIKISTKALNADTNGNEFNSAKEITVTDTVTYQGLIPNQEYTMHATLMNKETGEAVLNEDGTLVEGYKKFTPKEADGTIDVQMVLDASQLGGQDFVVFESLLNTGVEGHEACEIAKHHDLTDEDQTITIRSSEIQTTAKSENGSHEQQIKDGKLTLVDTVSYKNLVKGIDYIVKGTLMNKETGEPLLVDGEEVTAESTFYPEEPDGTVDVTFEFDASSISPNSSLVVFETLYELNTDKEGVIKEIEVTRHEDIEDEGQTIHFIDLHTKAESENGSDEQQVTDEEVTITDTVSYEGLQVGKEYTVKGTLMNKETGEPLLADGKEVVAKTTFTPETADGETIVEFTFSMKGIASGTDLVVFEDLYRDDVLVATHSDLEDEGQTIHVIDLHTTATAENGTHTALAGEEVMIIDTVTYEGLKVDEEYTISGKLMNKETGEPLLVDGEEVVAETTFTPEEPNGSVDLIYTLDSSALVGQEIVVFEDLYRDDVLVATHSDLEDKDQTVKFKNFEVMINKVDSVTGKNITNSDFEFTMYEDEECTKAINIAKGDNETGTALFEITKGVWYIKETKAPEGYKLSDEVVTVEVKDNQLFVNEEEVETDEDYVYSIVYQNALLPVYKKPNTSTENGQYMFMSLGALALCGLGGLGYYDKKRKGK